MSSGSASTMEGASYNPEKDSIMMGGLFQSIINDLRGSSPIWEDFTYKSVKLHASLKTTVVAVGAFLEAFQKVADMATSSKGATREIGSALTRLCMRHRSIESHLKALTSSILDNLVAPLQDKLEDWKKAVAQLDKDHSKDHKKAKQDIKKAASDTIRLQKKVRKGSTHGKSDVQQKLDSAMLEVNSKYHQLEEAEKNSVRSALIEERSRFCLFITCLKPFVDQELKLLTEMTHINEIMDSLCMQASEPSVLPASSEQVILDLKGVDTATFSFSQAYQQSSPPSSPSSLGSRKSSMCSINSINSSSSGSSHSPSHTIHKHHQHHAYAQPPPSAVRLTSVSSQDSGFTSQDTLFLCHPQSLSLYQGSDAQERDECDSTPTTPSDNTPSASSTWNNWPNMPGNPRLDQARPHTISSAYEKGHSRPALKPDVFEPPQEAVEIRPKTLRSQSQGSNRENRPSATISKLQPVLPPHCPKPRIKAVAPPVLPPGVQPIYANMSDLAQRGSQVDLSPDDGEPTTPTTPANTSMSLGESTSVLPATSLPVVILQPLQRMTALELAMEQMDICTASLNLVPDQGAGLSESVTPRSSTNDLSLEPSTSLSGDIPVATSEVEIGMEGPRVKIQQNTSLELAKAIRELEASTAALTSAYDSDTYATVNNHAVVTSTVVAICDTDSYTSKMSLQCSSGYGTMNSTPASSEDTIASGDCAVVEAKFDTEKYYTIPRSGETRAAYRAAMHTQRPASTTGIPIAGPGVVRRSSMSTQKPPPPVRRTASVSGVPSHIALDGQGSSYATGGGEGLVESPYAELQLIQQSIHDRNRSQAQYQQQTSAGDQPQPGLGHVAHHDGIYTHDTGGGGGQTTAGHPQAPAPTTGVIQSLNAKFASLNNQYQDGHGRDNTDSTSSGNARGQEQKHAPQVLQKPNKNAFPPPPSAMLGHPDQHNQPNPATPGGLSGPSQGSNPQHGNKFHGQRPQHLQQQFARQLHQQKQHQQQQGLYSDPASHQQHHTLAPHPEEDFPLPPTQEELQEIERIYGRHQPPGSMVRAPEQQPQQLKQVPQSVAAQSPHYKKLQQQLQLQQQHQIPHHHHQQQHQHQLLQQQQQHLLHQQQLQQQHHFAQQQQQHHFAQQQQQRHQFQQPQDVQASLLMELKKRVSVDENSEA